MRNEKPKQALEKLGTVAKNFPCLPRDRMEIIGTFDWIVTSTSTGPNQDSNGQEETKRKD